MRFGGGGGASEPGSTWWKSGGTPWSHRRAAAWWWKVKGLPRLENRPEQFQKPWVLAGCCRRTGEISSEWVVAERFVSPVGHRQQGRNMCGTCCGEEGMVGGRGGASPSHQESCGSVVECEEVPTGELFFFDVCGGLFLGFSRWWGDCPIVGVMSVSWGNISQRVSVFRAF